MTNRYTPDDEDDDPISLFDDEWYSTVSDAVSYTFKILEGDGRRIVANKQDLARAIIDYNINRRLTEQIASIPIPTVLDWSNSTSVEIFDEFASIVSICSEKKDFKKQVIRIKCGKNQKAVEQFLFWKDVNNNESEKIVISEHIQKNNTIVCTIEQKV